VRLRFLDITKQFGLPSISVYHHRYVLVIAPRVLRRIRCSFPSYWRCRLPSSLSGSCPPTTYLRWPFCDLASTAQRAWLRSRTRALNGAFARYNAAFFFGADVRLVAERRRDVRIAWRAGSRCSAAYLNAYDHNLRALVDTGPYSLACFIWRLFISPSLLTSRFAIRQAGGGFYLTLGDHAGLWRKAREQWRDNQHCHRRMTAANTSL